MMAHVLLFCTARRCLAKNDPKGGLRAVPGNGLRNPRAWLLAAGLVALVAPVLTATPVRAQVNRDDIGNAGVEAWLALARLDPAKLRTFVEELPKGGDLHTHLSGAASTELLITLAAQDGMCIDVEKFIATFSKDTFPPCGSQQRPAQDAVSDQGFRDDVIGAWSMEGFQPGQGETGRDHFFAAFEKFNKVTGNHRPEMLAQVVSKAADENEVYMESMTARQSDRVFELSQRISFDSAFSKMRDAILADGALPDILAGARAETDNDEAAYRQLLRCGTPQALRGCDLVLRYIHPVSRKMDPKVVFTFMLYGFELAEADGRYVALNLAASEDDPVALRDYHLHMSMLDYLRSVYSTAHITLHAGELVLGLVPAEELTYHIREAVITGHAERIGHGVDVRHEDHWPELMRTMAARHVMVESPLTSNAQILEVTGHRHPFPYYRALGVPVGLATDDEGVLRIDLTNEYQRAVTTYNLTYRDLKTLARTTLDHAFLPGESLWRGPDDFVPASPCGDDALGGPSPSPPCQALLDRSQKAALQWRHEAMLHSFEDSHSLYCPSK